MQSLFGPPHQVLSGDSRLWHPETTRARSRPLNQSLDQYGAEQTDPWGMPCSGKCNRYTCAKSCFFHDEDWVCQPLGVKHLHDKTCSLQLRNLFVDCPSLVLRETPQGLLDWLRAGPNV